jgi:hypothetical protein
MIIAVSVVGYFVIGIWLAGVFQNLVMDVSIQKQLNNLAEEFQRHPYLYGEYKNMTEKQRIEKALHRAKDYDEIDWQLTAALTFFFWPVTSIVFGIRYLFHKIRSVKFGGPSKFEKRLKELTEIEDLKTQAIENKKKYRDAIKLLKAEGINVGE